jgi:hypothetical protein
MGGSKFKCFYASVSRSHVIPFVQEIEGVAKIKDSYNPATWMLEVTTVSQEFVLGVDFSDIYKNSELYQSVTFSQPY